MAIIVAKVKALVFHFKGSKNNTSKVKYIPICANLSALKKLGKDILSSELKLKKQIIITHKSMGSHRKKLLANFSLICFCR